MSQKTNKRARRIVKSQVEPIKRKLLSEICELPLKHRLLVAGMIILKKKPQL